MNHANRLLEAVLEVAGGGLEVAAADWGLIRVAAGGWRLWEVAAADWGLFGGQNSIAGGQTWSLEVRTMSSEFKQGSLKVKQGSLEDCSLATPQQLAIHDVEIAHERFIAWRSHDAMQRCDRGYDRLL
ncbi:hypothetical protein RJT34_17141 [Clitoria ternatea]|uniref:Uncharacterized protein n=1 Tax=Clitoria ternatea TaxID=43366 RepID=A0AAN9J9N8_CLITE